MARQFELRNGMIIKEKIGIGTNRKNGFVDDYIVIDANNNKIFKEEYYICLGLTTSEPFPIGGAHGSEYDIIKEIKEDK